MGTIDKKKIASKSVNENVSKEEHLFDVYVLKLCDEFI